MGKDIGTYHLRVEFENARGFYYAIKTGARYTGGTESVSPLNSQPIPATFDGEEELISAELYLWTEGNYSCDCNLSRFIAEAYGRPKPENPKCGNTIKLKNLALIRPDASELVIWPE